MTKPCIGPFYLYYDYIDEIARNQTFPEQC